MFIVALLVAISYAQTAEELKAACNGLPSGDCRGCLISQFCLRLGVPGASQNHAQCTANNGLNCDILLNEGTTTTTTTTTTSAPAQIDVVVGFVGYTDAKKNEICAKAAEPLQGILKYCDRDGPNQPQDGSDTSTDPEEVDLYMEVSVFNLQITTEFVDSGDYMTALEESDLPDGVSVVHADTYDQWSISSSYGDPIVWTFGGDCYDLNQDGYYLASSNGHYDHEVYISVYNHYMREIQVRSAESGDIMLSISNMGEVLNNNYPFFFKEEMKKCDLSADKCTFFYKEIAFDAQEFEFVLQILPHKYEDPSLAEGEIGVHLDIYPNPYPGFNYKEYNGLYFQNPIPETAGECPA